MALPSQADALEREIGTVGRDLAAAFPSTARRPIEAIDREAMDLASGDGDDRQPFGGSKLSGTGPKAGGPDYFPAFGDAHVVTENIVRHGLMVE